MDMPPERRHLNGREEVVRVYVPSLAGGGMQEAPLSGSNMRQVTSPSGGIFGGGFRIQ